MAIIDQIFVDDEVAPPKQRHTAMQGFRRLRHENGYRGCYGQVQRYLSTPTPSSTDLHPLGDLQGSLLEADFGHIHVDFPDGRQLVPFLVTTWAHSNAPFVGRSPERTEAILAGMVAAFELFDCIPKEVWWDNPKTVATLILRKPGALDHAPLFRDWKLPACFAAIHAELEQHHGTEAGARRFVRIMQLLGEHPLDRVQRAVEACSSIS